MLARQRDLPTSLDLLRGFEAAARLLSFTAAASELFLTQSAISRQVQQLEEQLGVKLFERRTRALVLTDAGDRYYRDVSKVLDTVARGDGRRTRAGHAGRARDDDADLRLVVAGATARRFPERSMRTFRCMSSRTTWCATSIAIRSTSHCATARRKRRAPDAERLFGEQVAPVAAPGFLKGQRIRSVEDLLRLPLIELEDPTGTVVAVVEGLVRSDEVGAAAHESRAHVQPLRPGRAGGGVGTGGGTRPLSAARSVPRRATARHAAEGTAIRDARAPCLLAGRSHRAQHSVRR